MTHQPTATAATLNGMPLFHTVRTEERRCEYGGKHNVQVYEAITVFPTDRTWPMDNGYEKRQEAVYEDAEGREYRRMVTIDFYNNVYYVTDDRGLWYPRPPANGVPLEAANV